MLSSRGAAALVAISAVLMNELPDLNIMLANGAGFMPCQIDRFRHGHQARDQPKVNHCTSPRELFKRFTSTP
ncbi:MAG: hypothetical protein ACI8W7_003417 [Gammaproteobacteria bacterium]|jgi:hypothetical protein